MLQKKAHEFPTKKRNLLSVPLLCNANCITAFCKDKVLVPKDSERLNKCLEAEKPILTGKRDYSTNLWEIPVGIKTVESTPKQEITIARDMNNNPCKMKIAGSNKREECATAQQLNSSQSTYKCLKPRQRTD